ncbi:MAG: CADD family putative folate metabolism protein [Acidobacteria bacterium]|nr:CADD family putative folate metabolism protein [Acidobacteriota bacterium]
MNLDHTSPTPDAVLERLEQRIAERSILKHPFYQAWNAGALDREQLATYARFYYPHVAAFPGHLEAAADNAADAVIRAELLDNLREERSEPRPHPEIWLSFAAALGLEPEAVEQAAPAAAAQATVDTFRELCEGDTAGALAALYCYESQQPEVSHTKAEGLKRFYGVDDAEGLEYFTVHQEADLRHREGEIRSLRRCLEAGADGEAVLAAAERALDAYWGLLDGVCEEARVLPVC